jgi:hypothetical protein
MTQVAVGAHGCAASAAVAKHLPAQGAQRRYHRHPERPGRLRRSKDHLRTKLAQFICEWNQQAHPVNWSMKSVAKVMAEAPARAA